MKLIESACEFPFRGLIETFLFFILVRKLLLSSFPVQFIAKNKEPKLAVRVEKTWPVW